MIKRQLQLVSMKSQLNVSGSVNGDFAKVMSMETRVRFVKKNDRKGLEKKQNKKKITKLGRAQETT